MSIAYLVKKTTVLQNGLKTTVNENIIYPFDDMSIAVSQEELDGKAKVELATTGTIFDIVADSLANSHHEVFGTLSLDTYTSLATTLSTFNGGGSIEVITKDGTQNITKNDLTVGSILQVKFLDSSRPEEVAFYNDQSLHQITFNNEDKQAFTEINAKNVAQDTRLTTLETNVALKANTNDVYAKTETYSKTELDSSQAGQDTKIEANRVKNVAQDTRLDSLETLTTPLPARITTLETTSTSYGTRISAVETKATTNSTDITALSSRVSVIEGNPAAQYKSAVRKWVGTQNGNAPTAASNTTVIELSSLVADDTKTFEFTSGKELRIWVKATSASLGSLIVPVDIIAGRTEPLLIEAVKGSTGTTLEVLSALLNTTGQLTITRNAGTDIQFNTIQAVEIKEDILALATSLASKTELAAVDTKATTASTTATEALAKVNAIDLTPITTNIANNTAAIAVNTTNIAANTTAIAGKQSATDQSLTTTSKAVVGAINEVNGAYKAAVALKANGNLKVQSISGQQVDLSVMDGSIDDKLLPSLKFIEGTFETTANVNTKIATKLDKPTGLVAGKYYALKNDYTFEEITLPTTPTWKDITATYKTRVWTADDIGKKVRITLTEEISFFNSGLIYSGLLAKYSSYKQNKVFVEIGNYHYANDKIIFGPLWEQGNGYMNTRSLELPAKQPDESYQSKPITKFEIYE